MLQTIGCFHFGAEHHDPVRSLERALREETEAAGALIVLPEAFNIGVAYRGLGDRDFEPTIRDDLQRLAQCFGVKFVASLVVREPGGPMPPYSAAYFVDGVSSTLMCYKIGSDETVGVNYCRAVLKSCIFGMRAPILYLKAGRKELIASKPWTELLGRIWSEGPLLPPPMVERTREAPTEWGRPVPAGALQYLALQRRH